MTRTLSIAVSVFLHLVLRSRDQGYKFSKIFSVIDNLVYLMRIEEKQGEHLHVEAKYKCRRGRGVNLRRNFPHRCCFCFLLIIIARAKAAIR